MDILLDNPLASMYGPYFLVLYGFVNLFTLIFLWFAKSGIDKTNNLPLPPIPARIDPFEIAYLRGGINEVARSVIFSLMQKNYVELKTEGKTSQIKRINNQNNNNLSEIEREALSWIGCSRDVKDVFQSSGLGSELENYGKTFQARLESQHMLVGDDLKISFSPWRRMAYLIILGLGAYKILAALAYGQFNFIGIIVLALCGFFIARAVAKLPRITELGKAYLERLQLAFDTLKYQSQAAYIPTNQPKTLPQTTFGGVDPLLLSVGVFGSGILVGTVFDSYNQAFQKAQQQSAASSCGSGCGSSCSSGSSSDGGSSCGSGCGGCGGGCS
jgi:uncharacterized protein (TIGR04222 family)